MIRAVNIRSSILTNIFFPAANSFKALHVRFVLYLKNILHIPFICLLLVLFVGACKNETREEALIKPIRLPVILTDTSDCFLDSMQIGYILSRYLVDRELEASLYSFYSGRGYVTAWYTSAGLNEHAGNFINMLRNEELIQRHSSSRPGSIPDDLYRKFLERKNNGCNDSLLQQFEILLTVHFFSYAGRNWGGAGEDIARQAGWFIVKKELDYEQLLNDFLSAKNRFAVNEPVYGQYILLKQFLRNYHDIEMNGGWPAVDEDWKFKKGETSHAVDSLRKILFIQGDLPIEDSGKVYNDTLEAAVSAFQRRHGLEATGIPGKATLAELAVPVQERIRQLLINMERCRWVPNDVKGDYVIVNIPQFMMHVYEKNALLWSCNVIVGKSNAVNRTVIFNDSIEFVVFSPYWNIPKNIFSNEVLPAIRKDPQYLQKNNMEVVDRKGRPVTEELKWEEYTGHFPYILRERPGRNNSLGKVKFLFPNPYEIYLHDTPARALFGKTTRTFSHGCIRIEEPFRFAQYLLRQDTTWTDERIRSAMEGGTEIFVKLKKKVPVFIAYFTSWVDGEGRLNFRQDVYGHDARMKQLLFVN
jgi:L,D-transpeptidase YcbB